MVSPDLDALIEDPSWLAHRYDEARDEIRFRRVPREAHRAVTFLTDAELGADEDFVAVPRHDALAAVRSRRLPPPRIIAHSAYCCSTMLVRAFDVPGAAMGLSEPVILNDVIGLRLRGGDPRQVAAALDAALALLARPFAPGEAVVIKPSNVVNPLLSAMQRMVPDLPLLLLHAPLEAFVGSIARKEIEGRSWARELAWKLISLGQMNRFGFSQEELFRHTDLQSAALAWLAQQAAFADLATASPATVRSLDSDRLTHDAVAVMSALATHFAVAIDPVDVVQGPAFRRHAKHGHAFDAAARDRARDEGLALHAREIGMVVRWARSVAAHAATPMVLPSPLLD